MGLFSDLEIDDIGIKSFAEEKQEVFKELYDSDDVSKQGLPTDYELDILRTNLGIDPGKQAVYPNWTFNVTFGQARNINAGELRTLAKSNWCQMPLNTFKKRVFTTDWDIVPEDEDDETDYSKDIEIAKEKLKNLNSHGDSINKLCMEAVNDIGVIDSGIWNMVYSTDSYNEGVMDLYDNRGNVIGSHPSLILKPFGQRELVMLNSVDGATILKQVDVFKNLLGYWQYSFKSPFSNPLRFERDEIIYMMLNPQPDSVYGFAPVESIQMILEMLIEAVRYDKDMYKNNAIPDMLISLGKMQKDQLNKIKRGWYNKFQNRPHKVGFINWPIDSVHKLVTSPREMEWLGGIQFFYKIPFGVFNVSPTECGFFENANKSNDEGQEDATVRNALEPYYRLLADTVTNRILPEIWQKKLPLKFKWLIVDNKAKKAEFDIDMEELKIGALTINDYRRKTGREEYEWGDEPLKRPFNPENSFMNFTDQNNGGNDPNTPNNQEPKEITSSGRKSLSQKSSNIPPLDIVSQASDYSSFLLNMFDGFEKKVISAIDDIYIQKDYTTKTFGDFLKGLFAAVNTKLFIKQVKKYIRADMMAGLVNAETELDIDIPFNESFETKLAQLHSQQINGYSINGKKWYGIKGVTKEIQHKIISTVQDGVDKKKSLDDMKEDVGKVFDGFSEWRSEMIARTETNRILGESTLLGYKESGIAGKKAVNVSFDNRTSDICKRMDTKYGKKGIPLDDDFMDDDTQKAFQTPPFHVNCRTRIYFLAD